MRPYHGFFAHKNSRAVKLLDNRFSRDSKQTMSGDNFNFS